MKLDNTNYLGWSHSVKLSLRSKGKLGYVTGTIKAPEHGSPTYEKWETENSTVMTWLIFSVKPEIRRRFMRKETTKAIWDSISQTFDRVGDSTKVYQLHQKINSMRQGDRSISKYYNAYISLLEEYAHYRDLQLTNPEDEAKVHHILEKECVFTLLGGLNPDYEPIRLQILGRSPFPFLDEVSTLASTAAQSWVIDFGATDYMTGFGDEEDY
ncbi:uncharacterized protein LOC122638943 [Telopea speciosissima]|uniref:uncharacterized protein LOC122638943 n=1 Tax=Telopea speciosissima TaxID=54955 RepID=UPI001CC6AB37|nr:uncharacterized protein LOC122638943 [Telopea speciosissima]